MATDDADAICQEDMRVCHAYEGTSGFRIRGTRHASSK